MRVLVLGGTGAMGKHLVEILCENGCNHVVVTSRKRRQRRENLDYLLGDAHDLDFLSDALHEKWDCIIDFMAYTTEEFSKRMDLLLDSTDRYVFLSSSRVYADSRTPLTESSVRLLDSCTDTEYLRTDEYALSKARQEDLLFESRRRNWIIIRPYITFSEERLQLGEMEKEEWLFIALRRGVIPFSHDVAEKKTTLTYGRDVAKGIARLIERGDSLGNAYHLTSGQAVTWKEVLDTYLEVIGRVLGREVKVSYTERSRRFDRGGAGIYQMIYDRLYDRVFSTERFGLDGCDRMNDPALKKLALCLETFLLERRQDFRPACWSNLGRYDRESGEWENILAIPQWKDKLRYIAYRLNLK